MRLVIDMQGAQTGSRFRGIGRYTRSFVKALIEEADASDEIILVFNGMLSEGLHELRSEFESLSTTVKIKEWSAVPGVSFDSDQNHSRRIVASLLREAFINSLNPDICLLTSVFEGHSDDCIVTVGELEAVTYKTVAIAYDLIPLIN